MVLHIGSGAALAVELFGTAILMRCLVHSSGVNRRISTRTIVTIGSVTVALLCMSCGSPPPPDGQQPPRAAIPAEVTNFDQVPGKYPVQDLGIPGADTAPVGACVSLAGPQLDPVFSVVDCGAPTNGYKVVQRVRTPDECPNDVDQRFYLNPEGGQWTACLDYAWSIHDCLSIGHISATRVACDDQTTTNREKPTQVLLDSTTAADCPDGGFAHPVRKFTICTETQK